MKVIHLLCTYFPEADIPHSICAMLWLAKAIVIKLICQINYYYFTRITRGNITMLLTVVLAQIGNRFTYQHG